MENALLKLIKKNKKEISQDPPLEITGKIPEPNGSWTAPPYGLRWICVDCCRENGNWDGRRQWQKGKCDWCDKPKTVIESDCAGYPNNIKEPDPFDHSSINLFD